VSKQNVNRVRYRDRLPLRSSQANPVGRYATPADGRDVISSRLAIVVAVERAAEGVG
jgi:hypothetical protein